MTYCNISNQTTQPFLLPELPYSKDSLLPYLSEENFDYHHGKHHNAYVVNLNKLLEGNDSLQAKSLEEIIEISSKDNSLNSIFNNAAQVWNHTFYWNSMKPKGGGQPQGTLAKQIEKDFGSYDKFAEEFKQAGGAQFGSGWVWLVLESDKLKVVKTANASTPITSGQHPIVTCDVWEHAYYIDFRNKRPDYLAVFLEHLVNWDFAEKLFAKAQQ